MSTQNDLELTLRLIKDSMRRETEPNGAITDTLWMPTGTETVFDALDRAIEQASPLLSRIDALSKDAEAFNFLEYMSEASRTGVTLQYIKGIGGEPTGYRVMSFHDMGEVFKTAIEAVEDANERQGLPPLVDAAISAREGE